MATVAIGDIHGNLSALEDLLAKVTPAISRDDTLVFLGDYIDRGPDSRGCLERILRLKCEALCPVVTLLGNHEDWMLRTLSDPTCHSWILGMEAFETIASYSEDAAISLRQRIERAGLRLITERMPLPYELFFDLVPPSHLDFLNNLTLYYRSPNVVCVHGGIDLEGSPLQLQEPDTLLWGPQGFPDGYRGTDAVVYGHWDNSIVDEAGWPCPRIGANHTFGIDTISHEVLTAMSFPDCRIIQSGKYADPKRVQLGGSGTTVRSEQ